MAIRLLVLSGRSGSGKTAVANEMASRLRHRGLSHVHIDGDNLDAIYPEDEGAGTMLANLAAMWSNFYYHRGITRLIISGTAMALELDRIQDTIERASQQPGKQHDTYSENNHRNASCPVLVEASVAILIASDEVALERLTKREVGSELAQLLASSNNMASVLQERILSDAAYRVSTEGRDVREIALDVLRHFSWITETP